MSCLTPGPALVMTRMVPGIPPRRGEPIPAPAWPLTINCWLSASHQMVALRASNSSLVRYSWARSQILGGSVTWASQSKVAKSLVMGAKVCTGMLYLLLQIALSVFEPTRRHRHCVMAREDGVNGRHIRLGNDPTQRSEVLLHLGGLTTAHQRYADHGITRSPAQRELRQGLAIFGRQSF